MPIGGVRAGYLSGVKDAIPDSGLLHSWDWSATSSTTSFVEDKEGSADLSGSFNGFGAINGKQAGNFDTADIFETSSIQSFNSNRLIATVFQSDPSTVSSSSQHIWDNDNNAFVHYEASGAYKFNQNADVGGGTPSSNPHISTVQIDTTDVLRIDGVQIGSGDAGSNTLDTFRVGLNRNGEKPLFGQVGEILIYDLSLADVGAVESYLSNKWGVSI
jgi:hypothetical protein